MSQLNDIIRALPGTRRVARKYRSWRRDRIRWQRYQAEFTEFSAQSKKLGRLRPDWDERFPCLEDRTFETSYEPHYTLHCAWACRVLQRNCPSLHVDIGSSIMFVAMASAFLTIHHHDIRPPKIKLNGLSVGAADLHRLPFANRSIGSLSCLHVIEHVGLGRYGDGIDADGDRKAAMELSRVLAPGGSY